MVMNNTTGWHWLFGRVSGRDTVEVPDSATIYGKVMIRAQGVSAGTAGATNATIEAPADVTTEAHTTTFRTSIVCGNQVI